MPTSNRLTIKQEVGWFVAGDGFIQALVMLSDGAFRLFAWISINARRPSGQLEAAHKELAQALGKSRRAVGIYISELEQKGICRIQRGANQHARSSFEITDAFWPYERAGEVSSPSGLHPGRALNEPPVAGGVEQASTLQASVMSTSDLRSYVASVRRMFLALGCGNGSFGPVDKQTAADLANKGVSLELVGDALLMGETRKYMSWLNNGDSAPIGSLNYFAPVIDELGRQPLSSGYRDYLRAKTKEFAKRWANGNPRLNRQSGPDLSPLASRRDAQILLAQKSNRQPALREREDDDD